MRTGTNICACNKVTRLPRFTCKLPYCSRIEYYAFWVILWCKNEMQILIMDSVFTNLVTEFVKKNTTPVYWWYNPIYLVVSTLQHAHRFFIRQQFCPSQLQQSVYQMDYIVWSLWQYQNSFSQYRLTWRQF